jgi:hypothetical protein
MYFVFELGRIANNIPSTLYVDFDLRLGPEIVLRVFVGVVRPVGSGLFFLEFAEFPINIELVPSTVVVLNSVDISY